MKNKLILLFKMLVIIFFNHFLIMIIGFLWYKLSFAKIDFKMLSGVETFNVILIKYQSIYYLVISIIEFLLILFNKKIFKTFKNKLIYYILITLLAFLVALYNKIGFGMGIVYGENIIVKDYAIFIACLGLKYQFFVNIFHFPTLLAFYIIRIKLWKE